jgi:hypothetical protein
MTATDAPMATGADLELDELLITNGFERSPFGDHAFKWANGRTAVYLEPLGSGEYSVSTYRPYGAQAYYARGLAFRTAVSYALSEAAAAHVTH